MTDYKLVPVEPTEEMAFAGIEVYGLEDCADADVHAVWEAMLAAAPAVQGEAENWREKVADLIKAAHCEGQKSATGRDPSPFRWVNSGSYKAAQALLAAPTPEAVKGEPVAWLAGEVCGGDASHNTVNVELDNPAPWSALPMGARVAIRPLQPAEQQPSSDESLTPVPDEVFAAEFAAWWEEHGQFCRAGGGTYERSFAFEAWRHLYPQLMNLQMAAAEQQPELAKYQPCGCVICTCEHETQCQGCGAHHCGTHPIGRFPAPAYFQPLCPTCRGRGWDVDCNNEFRAATCPDCAGSGEAEHSITVQESGSAAPDVAKLVEALEWLRGAINATPENNKVQAGTWISTKHPRIKQIDAILAAHRKEGE